ncbi:hypothetical protein V6N12_036393 [Hibiscus sabdariffa]|uniref:Uncharacterized protein n=1 Tax=Hibiscus sabdariffa TaxID=183260 RepID=A0ABR2EQL1_9ROSI
MHILDFTSGVKSGHRACGDLDFKEMYQRKDGMSTDTVLTTSVSNEVMSYDILIIVDHLLLVRKQHKTFFPIVIGETFSLLLSSFGSGNICEESSEPLEQHQQLDSQSLPNGIGKTLSTHVFNQALQLNHEYINKGNCSKHLQSPSEGANDAIQTSNSSLVDPLGLPQDFA